MEIYLINLFFVYVFLFLSTLKCSKVQKYSLIFISFLSMVFIAGIRYDVGSDFLMYESFFLKIKKYTLVRTDLEFMFILICKIIRLFSSNSAILFTVIAVFIYYYIYNVSIKNVKKYELAIFLFVAFGFFTNSLNLLRQWMAIPLIFKAFDCFSENKKNKGYIYIALAVLCHYTCAFCIPIFIFIYKLKSERIRNAIIIAAMLLYAFTGVVNNVIYLLFSNLGIGQKYLKYLVGYKTINTSIFVMPMFTLVTYLGYYFFLKNKKYVDDKARKFNEYMVNFTVIGFFVALLGTKLFFLSRIQFYFCLSIIFLIPNIISNIKGDMKKLLYAFCLVMGIVFYIYSLNGNGGKPLPYQTIYNKGESQIIEIYE